MERRSFLHTVLAGAGLAAVRPGFDNAFHAVDAGRAPGIVPPGVASGQAASRLPIIDVHLHAYPADAPFTDGLANPATGKVTAVKNGAEHLKACRAEMVRLNIVKGVVSGGDGDRLAAAWR